MGYSPRESLFLLINLRNTTFRNISQKEPSQVQTSAQRCMSDGNNSGTGMVGRGTHTACKEGYTYPGVYRGVYTGRDTHLGYQGGIYRLNPPVVNLPYSPKGGYKPSLSSQNKPGTIGETPQNGKETRYRKGCCTRKRRILNTRSRLSKSVMSINLIFLTFRQLPLD